MTKIKITLPEVNINPEELKARNRKMFTDDLEKEGMLAKVLVFLYLNQPISTTELTNQLSLYYKKEIDRVKVFRTLDRLVRLGFVFRATSGYILALPPEDCKKVHGQILDKYRAFVNRQPKQFQNRYTEINYFWLANGEGIDYLEWCCELLNFKFEKEKKVKK